jgi:orotidine-5'-phosphate decarboxylase
LKHFADRLAEAVRRRKTPAMVGLDPRFDLLPAALRTGKSTTLAARAGAYRKFCRGVIDVVAPLVPAVKLQLAFFEELGPPGMATLADVIAYSHDHGLIVILDGKRNDIGSTAVAYARGYLGSAKESAWGGDALTVSPYLGEDSLAPFAEVAEERGAGIFVLVKTSNPGSRLVQGTTASGEGALKKVARHVEKMAKANLGRCGYGSVGAVVGATFPEQLAGLRREISHAWFLVPGYGSQGGRAEDLAPAFDDRGLGAIVNSSRDIIFAHARKEYAKKFGPRRWQEAVEAATLDMIADLRANTPAGALK